MSVATSQHPLDEKTILVTRAAGQSSQFGELLQQAGATVIEMPALEICPPTSWDAFDQAIAQVQEIHWLILTSANGVTYFFKRLFDLGYSNDDIRHLHIAVVGKKTAACLKHMNIVPDFIPPDYVADSLVEHFPDRDTLHRSTILFPRVEQGGREVLVKELSANGATVIEVPVYQSVCPAAIAPPALDALQQKTIDVITFASSKTVRHFCQMIEQATHDTLLDERELLATHVKIASIGPQTSLTCHQLLGRVDIEAETYTLEGLTTALINWALSTNKSI
ncbi:MAG: uroporphyrinogen-III synthase [Cyanobacteria bacterium J06627_8]